MSIVAKIAKGVSHRSFAGRAIRLPLRMMPNNVVVPVLGGFNRGMRWLTGAGTTSGCWLGTYEEDHFQALGKIVQPGMVAFDLGANAGFYTLALSRLVGDSGRVFAFEPDARCVYLLRRHIDLNKLRNVTIVQAAVSDSIGLVAFNGWELMQSSEYVVPSVSLDEFIGAGNPRPDFVKMDIEGAEVTALKGARNLLTNARTTWLMAPHSEELTVSCKTTFTQNGYRLRALDCVSDAPDAGDFMALAIGAKD
ncbi:MAG TPA: FkbM family methyltransferase [Terracidiphilus sp.]|jgi:FkbM family methyltransferase